MINLKSSQEMEMMSLAGQILKGIIQRLKTFIVADRTTKQIDGYALDLITRENATAAFKGYNGFPANVCISINEEVVHGIPSEKKIKYGDIVSLDIGIAYNGFFADSAFTLPVGKIKPSLRKLIRVTQECLTRGIKQARPGKYLGDISYSIQNYVESNGFSVVRQFVGHGIGLDLHEEPEIPNFGKQQEGTVLKAGMVLAIEPMVNMGGWEVETSSDGWTVITKDRLPSAHFEHTVAVTEQGPKILT